MTRDRVAAGAMFVFLLLLYGALPSQRYDLDTLPELARLERGPLIDSDPAHGFYVPMSWVLWQLTRAFDPDIEARTVQLMVNAILGAATGALFASVLARTGIARSIAIPIALATGFSYGFWSHVADAFFIVPAAAAAVFAWWAALRASETESPSTWWRAAAGAAFGLAVLLHQANLLLAPALMVAIHRPGDRIGRTLKRAAVPVLAAMAVALPFWVAQAVRADVGLLQAFGWFVGTHGGMSRGLWRRDGVDVLSVTLVAWLATIVPVYEGLRLRQLFDGIVSLRHLPAQISLGAFALATAGAVAGFGVRRRRGSGLVDKPEVAALLWFVLPGIAVAWFDRAEVKLWIIPFFGLWLLIARGLASLTGVTSGRSGQTIRAAPMFLASALFLGNLLVFALPAHSEPSAERMKAEFAAARMSSADVVISASFDWTGHLDHLCDTCRVLNLLGIAQGGGDVLDAVRQARIDADRSGGVVYLVGPLADAASAEWQDGLVTYTGLMPTDVSRLSPEPAWTFEDGEIVWQAAPISVSP